MAVFSLQVNGQVHRVDVDPSTPLLWVLRYHLGMTGTKYGCGISQCGACTVHLNGGAVRSCQLRIDQVAGTKITTIEGLSKHGDHILQRLWAEMNVPQCGYCQSGILMTVAAMLAEVKQPTDQDIDRYVSNICRCGTYPRIRAAIHRATRAASA